MTASEVVDEFADFLKNRAKTLYERTITPGDSTPPLPKTDWLMSEIGELIDKDEWDSADIARLSALFFFLLVGPKS